MACVLVLASSLTAGCLPIPVPPHALGVVPDREAAGALAIGLSRRADVLLRLGEPRYRVDGDRFLLYEWDVAYGYVIIGGPGAATGFPVSAPHYLCFEFDAEGLLARKAELSGKIYGSPDKAISECTNAPGAVDDKGAR